MRIVLSLAIIPYQQPVMRPQADSICGVSSDPSAAALGRLSDA